MIKVLALHDEMKLRYVSEECLRDTLSHEEMIQFLCHPHADEYCIVHIEYSDLAYAFWNKKESQRQAIWDMLWDVDNISVVTSNPDKFWEWRKKIFHELWDTCIHLDS